MYTEEQPVSRASLMMSAHSLQHSTAASPPFPAAASSSAMDFSSTRKTIDIRLCEKFFSTSNGSLSTAKRATVTLQMAHTTVDGW
jgi:hypothetical protein